MSGVQKTISCQIEARAKVNVTLEILGTRPDGYHDLRSIVMPVGLSDSVNIELTLTDKSSEFGVRSSEIYDTDKSSEYGVRSKELFSEHSNGMQKEDSELRTPNSELLLMPQFTLEVSSENVDISNIGSPESNLCTRAAKLFFERMAEKGIDLSFIEKVKISVIKRIPIGGGMGGGSADAAAVLRGLNKLVKSAQSSEFGVRSSEIYDTDKSSEYRVRSKELFSEHSNGMQKEDSELRTPNSELAEFTSQELLLMGSELGSDIPALILGGAVLMEGRGERVTPLCDFGGAYDILLVNPGIHVSTPAAYRAYDSSEFGVRSSELGATPSSEFGVRSSEVYVSNNISEHSNGMQKEDSELRTPSSELNTNSELRTPYSELLTNSSNCSKIILSRNCGKSLSDFSELLFNGLEGPVFEMHPEIAELARLLKDAGARAVLMSGSGATVFALVDSPEDAERLAQVVPEGYWVAISRMMPDGVTAAHGPLEA